MQEGWEGVHSQDTLIWKGNPNKEAFQQRLRLGFSQGQFGLGEASGRQRTEQEYMSWMLRGVRFPSTAWFCVTGWGTGCKLSSLFFFFFPSPFISVGNKRKVKAFIFFFFNKGKIKVPIPCAISPVGLAMPLAVGAGGGPIGASDLEKPSAVSQAGIMFYFAQKAFYFAQKSQLSCRPTEGILAGAWGAGGIGAS